MDLSGKVKVEAVLIKMKKYSKLLYAILAVWALCFLSGCEGSPSKMKEPIKVGVLHSQTGPLSLGETSIMNATLLAIEEINRSGGVLGRQVQPVVVDGASDPDIFRYEAKYLIDQEHVVAIFGCLTSACRKAVKEVVESRKSILFYPIFYEGLEASPNVIYLGAAPNQSVMPAVKWAHEHFGNRYLVLGSESIFSLALIEIIKEHVNALGGSISEIYLSQRGGDHFNQVIQTIKDDKPDAIFSTQGSFLNELFFKELEKAEGVSSDIPIFLFGMSSMKKTKYMMGKYVTWDYYDESSKEGGNSFVKAFYDKYEEEAESIAEPMETAYLGVKLWAKAVAQAESADPQLVLQFLPNQSIQGGHRFLHISAENNHTYRQVRLGRVTQEGLYEVIWDSEVPVPPEPYPMFRTPQEWDRFMEALLERTHV